MKKIALSGKYGVGRFALVDDEDSNKLVSHSWQADKAKGYAFAMLKTEKGWRPVKMHRFLMNPANGLQVDHINGNKLDNRKENLRIATHSQNLYNWPKSKKRKYSSIYKGVCYSGSKWLANISKDRKSVYIGSFDTELHAAMAYDIWAKDFHGEFVNLNFKAIN